MKIGRRVTWEEIVARHGGARPGAGRPATGNKPVTLRLPEKLLEALRSAAKKKNQTLSAYVAARLAKGEGR